MLSLLYLQGELYLFADIKYLHVFLKFNSIKVINSTINIKLRKIFLSYKLAPYL